MDEANGNVWFTASQLVAAVSLADLTPVRSYTASNTIGNGPALSPDGATLYVMMSSESLPLATWSAS